MTDNDQHLADFTDQLLAQPHSTPREDLSRDEQLVRRLHDLVRPEREVPPALRQRLMRRLNEEWKATHRVPSKQRVHRVWRTRFYALAAALVVVLMGVAVVLTSDGSGQTGTAAGEGGDVATGILVIVIMGVGLFLGGVTYWWGVRRR